MAAVFVVDDLVERILIGLDVEDLMRCKSVCKSWYSLITSPGFINCHLNRSYNRDRCNNKLGDRRVNMVDIGFTVCHHLVGSSNGLVCIITWDICHVIVGNPLTREARRLRSIPTWFKNMCLSFSCWGFGYNSSTDDYKVILGAQNGNQTYVLALSLKSNVWRVIGEGRYRFITQDGILCNGALHWIVMDENMKKLIISYHLSKEELIEIPQPEDARYQSTSASQLGTIKGCLCIYHRSPFPSDDSKWLMKEYNIKQSWELLGDHDCEMNDIVHFLRTSKDYNGPESFFGPCLLMFRKASKRIDLHSKYIKTPIFVQSLVTPHANRRPNKRAAINEGTK